MSKAGCLKNRGKYDEAIATYDKAIEMKGDYYLIPYNRGVAFFSLKKYEEAQKCFDRTIELNKSYAPAYFNKGSIYIELDKVKEAYEMFTKANELDPNDNDIKEQLSYCKLKIKSEKTTI